MIEVHRDFAELARLQAKCKQLLIYTQSDFLSLISPARHVQLTGVSVGMKQDCFISTLG